VRRRERNKDQTSRHQSEAEFHHITMIRLLVYVFDIIASILLARMLSGALQRSDGTPRAHPWGRRAGPGSANEGSGGPEEAIRGKMARDPICGMFVSTELSQKLRQGERTLHFCSSECRNRYQNQERRAG
jgi:YHS domain-containing protein